MTPRESPVPRTFDWTGVICDELPNAVNPANHTGILTPFHTNGGIYTVQAEHI